MNRALGAVDHFERDYVRPRAPRALVVGSHVYPGRTDRRDLFKPRAEGWDMAAGDGVDLVVDLELDQALPPVYTHVDCMSVLEHSKRPWLLARNIELLLVSGGTLYVNVPFVWRVHAYPNDYWRFTANGIRELFPNINWEQIRYAHTALTEAAKLPSIRPTETSAPYFARTQVCAFGHRKDKS